MSPRFSPVNLMLGFAFTLILIALISLLQYSGCMPTDPYPDSGSGGVVVED